LTHTLTTAQDAATDSGVSTASVIAGSAAACLLLIFGLIGYRYIKTRRQP
jgi:hypothetical protein